MAPLSTIPTPDPSLALPNKTALLLAQHHRLISSWLPLPHPTKGKPVSETSASDPQTNAQPVPHSSLEADFFSTPLPELCGIGFAHPPNADGGGSKELSTNEKLQKRLLGKNYLQKIKHGQNQNSERGALHIGSKPKPKAQQPTSSLNRAADVEGSDGEEEAGRSSLGKSFSKKKKRRKECHDQPETEVVEDTSGEPQKPETTGLTAEAEPEAEVHPSKKRGSNYLDDLLASRSLKKKRKKSKKEKHLQTTPNIPQHTNVETQKPETIDSTAEEKAGANTEREPSAQPPKKLKKKQEKQNPHLCK